MGTCLSSILIAISISYISTYAETVVCVKANNYCECDTGISGQACTLDCTTENKNCLGDHLVCRDNDDCTIVCSASGGCATATITCPANAKCIVDCRGASNACKDIIINVYNATNYTCLGGTNCAKGSYQINTNAPTTAAPTSGSGTSSPTTNTPTTASPITSIPTTADPTTASPTTTNPTTSNPTTNSPTTNQPTTSNPTTATPTTVNPTTSTPTTVNPTTSTPTTYNPTTSNPTTHNPTTTAPTTTNPTTSMPTTAIPTTDAPTSVPTTSNPTSNIPTTKSPTTITPTTYSPATSNPTVTTNSPTTYQPTTSSPTPLNPTTNNPTTNIPTTLNPTTSYPTTNAPTAFNPTTTSPTTYQPTTIPPTPSLPTTHNPTTFTPTTYSPTTYSPTTTVPTTYSPTTMPPSTTNPTTVIPTTSTPTTDNPSITPSIPPTQSPTPFCSGFNINLVMQFSQQQWEPILKTYIEQSFQHTVEYFTTDIWKENKWCVTIIIDWKIPNNRRRLLQANDIELDITFTFNTNLYNDYFSNYNKPQFIVEFQTELSALMGGKQADKFELSDPINTITPHTLQTASHDDNRLTIIAILFSIASACCCIISIYTIRLFIRYELKYENTWQGLAFAIKSVSISKNNKDEITLDEDIVRNTNQTIGVVEDDDMDCVESINATKILMEYMDEGKPNDQFTQTNTYKD